MLIASPKIAFMYNSWLAYRGNVSANVVLRFYERKWKIGMAITDAFFALHPPFEPFFETPRAEEFRLLEEVRERTILSAFQMTSEQLNPPQK